MPKTKNYVSHIGFRPIAISNRNVFVRELYDSTEYMLPPKTAYIDTKLISFLRTARSTEREINSSMSMSSNTNAYSYSSKDNLYTNVSYNVSTNSNTSSSETNRRRRGNFRFIEIKDIPTNSYVPLVVDITGASASDISNVMSKNLYIVYSDKETFDNNKRVLRNQNSFLYG